MRSFRQWLLIAHRWVGVAASAVLAIAGASGALMIWPQRNVLGKAAGILHETLALGAFGWWIVVIATIAAVGLEISGVTLWWKRKSISVRWQGGARRALIDLHHPAGIVGLLPMLVLAATGVGMAFVDPRDHPELRRVVALFHTARELPAPVQTLYFISSFGFVVQGATGVVMWWPRARAKRIDAPRRTPERQARASLRS